MHNIEKLQNIAFQNQGDTYLLQVVLVGLYSEWEGGIMRKIDELLEKANEHNSTKFKLKEEIFFGGRNRNINSDEFKKVWEGIFNEKYKYDNISSSFLKQRNKYAHGDFESTTLDYEELQGYFAEVTKIFSHFETKVDDFIERRGYIKEKDNLA